MAKIVEFYTFNFLSCYIYTLFFFTIILTYPYVGVKKESYNMSSQNFLKLS